VNKVTTYVFVTVLATFMLVSSIGVPVIMSHIHNPHHDSQSQHEESTLCCEDELETHCDFSLDDELDCKPSILASCCCCFLELRLVSFTYDTPVYTSIPIPTFIVAYVSQLKSSSELYHSSELLSLNLDLPPPKTIPQRLSLFQVYRI
jgi:hypothetical protein